jgi:hypothetical protein
MDGFQYMVYNEGESARGQVECGVDGGDLGLDNFFNYA